MSHQQFTFRDRIKLACLGECIEAGMDEQEMINAFRTTVERLKTEGVKTGAFGWLSPAAKSFGTLAMLGLPVAALGSATLGNIAGKTFKNVEIGRIPSIEELKLLDEIAVMQRNADDINRRTEENEIEKKQKSKPSVRSITF